jgi:hypothetical protein
MVAQETQGLRDFVPNIEQGGAASNNGAPIKKAPPERGLLDCFETVYAETVLPP